MFLSNSYFTKPIKSFKEAFDVLVDLQENEYLVETYFNDSRFSNAIFDFNYNTYQSYLNESYTAPLLEDLLNEAGANFTDSIAPNSKAKEIARYGFRGKPKNASSNNASSNNTQSKPNETKKDNDNSKNEDKTKEKGLNRSNSTPETAKELKDKGKFLWHNVKSFAKNVWEKIKELCKLIFRKLKEWTASHLDLYNSKDAEITRREYELLTRLPRILEKALAIANKNLGISEGALDKTRDQITEVQKEIQKVSEEAEKKEGNIKVGKNWLKTMSNVIQQLTVKLDKGNELLAKQLTEVERVAEKAKSGDGAKDAQTLLVHYKGLAGLFRTVASKIVEVANALMASIETTENNKAAADENADKDKQTADQTQTPAQPAPQTANQTPATPTQTPAQPAPATPAAGDGTPAQPAPQTANQTPATPTQTPAQPAPQTADQTPAPTVTVTTVEDALKKAEREFSTADPKVQKNITNVKNISFQASHFEIEKKQNSEGGNYFTVKLTKTGKKSKWKNTYDSLKGNTDEKNKVAKELMIAKVREALGKNYASSEVVLEFVEEDDFYLSKNVLVEELLEGLI